MATLDQTVEGMDGHPDWCVSYGSADEATAIAAA
jgi:hypothetical protein